MRKSTPLTSVVIPSLKESLLDKTKDGINKSFTGNFEIITVLDKPIRTAINEAVSESKGEYILKTDAHCSFCEGFDTILQRDYVEDSVVVARRYTLDVERWEKAPRIVDYYYLSCPWTHPKAMMMQSCPWIRRTEERMKVHIDDLMCFQGSMWMMSRKHWDWLGGLTEGDEVFAEHHEISMKTWLGGRRVMINKNAWYAHPAKRVSGYHMDMDQVYKDHDHSARYWTENSWKGQIHPFSWLIDKFWPLPTEHNRHRIEKYYWENDWREKYYV